jgi:hypothetical protein
MAVRIKRPFDHRNGHLLHLAPLQFRVDFGIILREHIIADDPSSLTNVYLTGNMAVGNSLIRDANATAKHRCA